MKVTGLLLFLILLIVLVVSVIVGNKSGYLRKEGFINYQKTLQVNESFAIPSYSSTNQVTKLFDNLFYDQANGNIVEIDSPQFLVGGNIDLAGKSIISTTVTTRSNPSSSSVNKGNVVLGADEKPISKNLSESATTSMSISYNSYKYFSQSNNTDKYCLFYMPWNNTTYMHIIDLTKNSHVATYSHLGANSGSKLFQSKIWPTDSNGIPNLAIGLNQVSIDSDRNNNSLVTDQYYDTKKVLYQVSQYVKYDITNGNLLLRTATGAIVYSRGNPVTSTSYSQPNMLSNLNSVVANVSFSPTIIPDSLGNNVILYIPDGLNTLIAVISLQNTASNSRTTNQYTLANVARFTPNTLDNGGNASGNFMAMINSYMNSGAMSGSMNNNQWNGGYGGSNYNNYWGPPTYGDESTGKCGNNSNDYLLKTQIVPPVCPSCPSCGTGGVCSNCGGQGGSGTKSDKGGTMVTGENEKQSMYDNLTDESSIFGEGVATTGKKDAQGNDIEWKSDIGKGTFSSNADPNTLAGGFVLSQYSMIAGLEEAAYTAADVAKTGIGAVKDTAVGLGTGVKDTAKEVTGLAKSTGSGAVDLAKSAGSGLMQMSKDGKTVQGGESAQGMGMGQASAQGMGMGQGMGSAQGMGMEPASAQGMGSGQGSASGVTGTGGPGTGSAGVSYSGPQSMDQYSYYGALPAKKPGNYIPVTADFSSFRH